MNLALAASAAFAYGFAKARLVGVRDAGDAIDLREVLDVAAEEVAFRWGLGDVVMQRGMGLSPFAANSAQAGLFGAYHLLDSPAMPSARFADATAGGFFYSYVYQQHGLLGSILAHLAHNAGVWAAV